MTLRTGRQSRLAIVATLVVLLAGCAGSRYGTPGPAASTIASTLPEPSIGPGGSFNTGDLRVLLVERFGPRWYCDPDYYPIARPSFDEQQTAIERFPEIQSDAPLFDAIVRHLALNGAGPFTDGQKLSIYQEWKILASLALDPAGNGSYRFDYVAQPVGGGQYGTETTGTIDSSGNIVVAATASAGTPNCPICLASGTPIDTPSGPIPVDRIRLGDAVWTLDGSGRRVAGSVIAVGSTFAPPNHRVIRLVLADGRTVTASPGHPLADGRRLGTLAVGDLVDGSAIVGLDSLPYGGGETFDLVVSGPTGIYLSDGIPLGTTLR
jgi:hypothetical protein